MSEFGLPAGRRDFPFLQIVHIASAAHPASYSTDTSRPFSGNKAARDMKLDQFHLRVVLKVRVGEAVTLTVRNVFILCTGTTVHSYNFIIRHLPLSVGSLQHVRLPPKTTLMPPSRHLDASVAFRRVTVKHRPKFTQQKRSEKEIVLKKIRPGLACSFTSVLCWSVRKM